MDPAITIDPAVLIRRSVVILPKCACSQTAFDEMNMDESAVLQEDRQVVSPTNRCALHSMLPDHRTSSGIEFFSALS
jgi:hypothetical protein